MGVAPIGLRNGIRLYSSYLASLLCRIIPPARGYHVEDLIPGQSLLTVRTLNVLANIRPGSEDLHAMTSAYEPLTSRWFNVEPESIVVDVGAHIGRYTLTAARRAERVIAIEADPSNFRLLKHNIRLNGFSNIIPLHIGVSDKRGKADFYMAEGRRGSTSSLDNAWSEGRNKLTIKIDCVRLDDLTEELKLSRVDWMKIDVEGHEVAVLEGGPRTLAMTRHLVVEVSLGNEEACKKLTAHAGLKFAGFGESYDRATNWFFIQGSLI